MMHLKATVLVILLMSFSVSGPFTILMYIDSQNLSCSAKRIEINIPPQNVSNNQEITWDKPRGLNGIYDVELHIFFNTQPDAGEVILSVGEGDTMKNCKSSNVTYDNDKELSDFQILLCQIMISDGQEIKLLYNGKRNLAIRSRPSSYIHFVNVNTYQVNKKLACKTDSGRINNLSISLILISFLVVMYFYFE